MLSIAVIGAGRIGHVHAKTIAAHPQAELALVCDPFEDAAEKLAATYGARSCKDAEEVFADPEIDAVIVGSPTPLHIRHLLGVTAQHVHGGRTTGRRNGNRRARTGKIQHMGAYAHMRRV